MACLIAVFAVSAIGAGSALASKDPYNNSTWGQYKDCPYENHELTDCFYGRTAGGSKGGEFKYGHVTAKLKNPIVIQGGFKGQGSEIEVSPEVSNGGKTLESPEEPIVGGLNVITPTIQKEAEWPQALIESFKAAKKNKETKANATIEMVGTECYTVPGCLDTESLIFEEPSPAAFRLPLKVKVTSPLLETLGGGPCQIGSDEHPIMQHLVTAGAGRAGEISFNEAFTQTLVANSQLVDVGWHITPESAANGCGGAYEAYIDRALNIALEVEFGNGFVLTGKTGITVLSGNLHDGAVPAARKQHEEGNPELP